MYTTTAGASGGKLGPFVGEVQQEVDIAEGLYVNYVRVGPLTGELEATWEVVNKSQWKVIFRQHVVACADSVAPSLEEALEIGLSLPYWAR